MEAVKMQFLMLVLLNGYCYSQSAWVQQASPTTQDLYGVQFLNSNTGYISGDTLMKTTNGGASWFKIPSAPLSVCQYFFSVDTGLAGAFKISKTNNGGTNWTLVTSSNVYPNAFSFINSFTGWVACGAQFSGDIYKTTNGGLNWTALPTNLAYIDVRFLNENTGYAVWWYGALTKTTDGGMNWSSYISPPGNTWSVFTIDTSTLYISCSNGIIYKSTNGGTNWILQQTPVTSGIYSIYFIDNNTGYAVGGTYSSSQVILKTTNGGNNWLLQSSVNNYGLDKVFFVNALTGWAVGVHGTILKTTNGGITAVEPLNNNIPLTFKLCQNYPNPFNPSTKIKFDIPEPIAARLSVFDIEGKVVSVLIDQFLEPGVYQVTWNSENVASGVYFCVMQAEKFRQIRKMISIK